MTHPAATEWCIHVSTETWEVLFHWRISTIFTMHVMWWSCLVYYSAFLLRLFHSKNVFNKTLEWSGLQSFLQSLISWVTTNITNGQVGTRPTENKRWPFCKQAVKHRPPCNEENTKQQPDANMHFLSITLHFNNKFLLAMIGRKKGITTFVVLTTLFKNEQIGIYLGFKNQSWQRS